MQLSAAVLSDPILLVDPTPPKGASALVRACIDHLRQGETAQIQLTPELLAFADRHRFRSLLAPLGDSTDAARQVTALQLQLASAARQATSSLANEGITCAVLKGVATASLDYPAGAVRHTGDVDLLVSPDDFDQASLVLARSNKELKLNEVERTFSTPYGFELDLHFRLFRFGPTGEDQLLSHLVALPDGMGSALDPAGRLVHAAVHLFLTVPGLRRISGLIDVALLNRNIDLDEDRVTLLGSMFGVGDLVAVARWLGESIGTDSKNPPPLADSAVNRAYLTSNRRALFEFLALFGEQQSIRGQLHFVAHHTRRVVTGNRT